MSENNQEKQIDVDSLNVGPRTLADIFGVSERWVRKLASDGIISKSKNGSYELIPSIKKYILNLKTSSEVKADDQASDAAYQLEKTKHERAKREKAELQLALMKGQLHQASDVERVMMDMLSSFKSKIRSLPVKIAAQIKPNMTMPQMSEIISLEIDSTLLELSEYDPVKFYSNDYIDIEEDSGDEE